MTTAVYRNTLTPSLSIPQTQNTAPVLEFNCLYTHDVRRKQKRWQDGFLRYHTFNKRVMVYDVPRNFIGDMHWNGEEGLHEGDEMMLQQEGVMVQVAENVGKTETDLSGLRRKKRQGDASSSSPIRAGTPVRTPRRAAAATPCQRGAIQGVSTHLKHRSLNALLGASRGPIGKAQLATESPYDQRHGNKENKISDGRRPSKRRRKEATERDITIHPSTAKQTGDTRTWAELSDAAMIKKAELQRPVQKLGARETIDLDEDSERDAVLSRRELSSHDSRASSSPVCTTEYRSALGLPSTSGPSIAGAHWSATAHTVPDDTVSDSLVVGGCSLNGDTASRKASFAAHPPDRRMSAGSLSVRKGEAQRKQEMLSIDGAQEPRGGRTISPKRGRLLRLATSAPRKKTLMCQNQLPKDSTNVIAIYADSNLQSPSTDTQEKGSHVVPKDNAFQDGYQERLARIGKKEEARRRKATIEKRVPAVPEALSVEELTSISESITRTDVLLAAASAEDKTTKSKSTDTDANRQEETRFEPDGEQEKVKLKHFVASEQPQRSGSNPITLNSEISKAASPPQRRRSAGEPVRYTKSAIRRLPRNEVDLRRDVGESANGTTNTGLVETKIVVPVDEQLKVPSHQQARQCRRSPKKVPKHAPANLEVSSGGTANVMLSRAYQPPRSLALQENQQTVANLLAGTGPWSREAFDLFDWRPPGWDEQSWSVNASVVES